ncbi:MAG: MliC family protein [Firmicutes bacterium]|nr:MliC family protein [Bacillota bacterium]
MKKIILVILATVMFASCQKDEIVETVIENQNGEKIEIVFNNTRNIATVIFQNDTILLDGQKPASGIWYEKDGYELRGKGEEIKLTRNGKVVYQTSNYFDAINSEIEK